MSQTPSSRADQAPSSLKRRRWAWLAIVALPVLAWLVLFIGGLNVHGMPIATGDELTDRLLQDFSATTESVVRRDSLVKYSWRGSTLPGLLSIAKLETWEPEFGDDPRYWQLLFNMARLNRWDGDGLRPDNAGPEWYLAEARRRGIADGPVLYQLLQTYAEQWSSEGQQSRVLTPETVKWTNTQNQTAIWQAVDKAHGAELAQLTGELLNAVPDEAQVLYYVALIDAARGDYDSALTGIRRGNQAPDNNSMAGFPFDYWVPGLRDRSIPEDKLIGGTIGMQLSSPDFSPLLFVKRSTKALIEHAIQAGSLEDLTPVHVMCCRIHLHTGSSLIESLNGHDLLNEVYGGFLQLQLNQPNQSSQENQEALQRLAQALADLRLAHRPGPGGALPGTWYNNALSRLDGVCSLGSASTWDFYVQYDAELTAGQRLIADDIQWRYAELEHFDYATLTWDDQPADAGAD